MTELRISETDVMTFEDGDMRGIAYFEFEGEVYKFLVRVRGDTVTFAPMEPTSKTFAEIQSN